MGAISVTTASPWSNMVVAKLRDLAPRVTTNLEITEPRNVLDVLSVAPRRGPNRLFAVAATRDFVTDPGIIFITRQVNISRSRWYAYVTKRLAELASGRTDYSDMPLPPHAACARALTLAENLFDLNTPTPSVVPSEEGTVVFVWRSQALELEIEVGSEETEVWAYDRPGGNVWSGQLEDRRASVSALLGSLEPH